MGQNLTLEFQPHRKRPVGLFVFFGGLLNFLNYFIPREKRKKNLKQVQFPKRSPPWPGWVGFKKDQEFQEKMKL